MSGLSFDTSELTGLAGDLAAAGPRAATAAVPVVRKAATDVEVAARSFAPVDTGALRNSITSEVRGLEAVVGAGVPYARFVEGGTSVMAPQAFMGPAFDRSTPGFVLAMEALSEGLL